MIMINDLLSRPNPKVGTLGLKRLNAGGSYPGGADVAAADVAAGAEQRVSLGVRAHETLVAGGLGRRRWLLH